MRPMTPDPSPLRPVRLVFGVHSHQPIGNFDSVFEKALRDAYDPFLDALERHPSITAVVHYSGCLCEWLESHAPGHLDRLAALARAGRVELLTGAFYEPILSLLPRTDAVGQIRLQTRYIRERFGAEPRGMWLAERIWEPTLPGILEEAGVDFTLLDDYHFLGSLDEDPGGGYYLTEDQGHVVRLFPISQPLRYLTPFREPEEAIRLLRTMAGSAFPEGPDPVAVIVDDGEKFGLWPGTHDWVHGAGGRAGWLDRFFGAVAENAAWLKTSTFEQVLATVPARGRVYLPPGSYFEMGEWALPKGRGRAFAAVVESSRSRGAWDSERPFLRGGFFRNFLAKYPESRLQLRRAQAISRQLDCDERKSPLDREGSPSQARRELWRATCNCGYWHGIFGGLYLPHIRRAIGTHLCRAGRLMDADAREASGALPAARARTRVQDVGADGGLDVAIETARLSLLVDPADGGAIRVLDVKARDFPLASTLTRRIEIYHDDVLRPARRDAASSGHGSIHDAAAEATDAMRELVVADDRVRASAVDRFLERSAEPADLARGAAVEIGDFFNGRYELGETEEASAAGAGAAASTVLSREGRAAGRRIA
ncbi:MAG TPA: alpha-amylase/4-alpha-glucanotransferase domain-containing protein, partial [Candidatus Polarisedimenticolia bacterium]|nr:alpha-amylase/4-alpha-glucanotransferase domain-containing protein [Candidatus Polarisedimenticolia bacterium]